MYAAVLGASLRGAEACHVASELDLCVRGRLHLVLDRFSAECGGLAYLCLLLQGTLSEDFLSNSIHLFLPLIMHRMQSFNQRVIRTSRLLLLLLALAGFTYWSNPI